MVRVLSFLLMLLKVILATSCERITSDYPKLALFGMPMTN